MNSRKKGHEFEREMVREMTRLRGHEYATTRRVAPHLDAQGIDGVSYSDVFDLQMKVGARPNIMGALEEMAVRDGKVRAVVAQRSRGKGKGRLRTVTVEWSDWERIMAMLEAA